MSPEKPSARNNFYLRLGAHRAMSHEDIVKLARILLRQHHPDKGGDEAKFKLISAAYTTLSSPFMRLGYDSLLEFAAPLCQACSGEGVTWKQESFFKRTGTACKACHGAGYVVEDSEWTDALSR
jgi:DnaJ-class molecular chaperone